MGYLNHQQYDYELSENIDGLLGDPWISCRCSRRTARENCVIPDGNATINVPSGFSHGESFKCTFWDSLLLMLISKMYHQKTLLKNGNWERILSFFIVFPIQGRVV